MNWSKIYGWIAERASMDGLQVCRMLGLNKLADKAEAKLKQYAGSEELTPKTTKDNTIRDAIKWGFRIFALMLFLAIFMKIKQLIKK